MAGITAKQAVRQWRRERHDRDLAEIIETLRIIALLAAKPPADFPTTLAKIAELAADQLARLEDR